MDTKTLRDLAVGDAAEISFGGQAVRVDLRGSDFVVKVSPMETERVRLVPGAKYRRHDDEWTMPATRAQAAALSGVFEGRLDPSDEVRHHVNILFAPPHSRGLAFSEHLFPFQRDGVEFCVNAGSALLGDQMGTGKTIQAIEWMRQYAGHWGSSHLVVCPNSMKFHWASEIEKWWPQATVIPVDGSAVKRRKLIAAGREAQFPVFVVNFESLRSHTRLAPWGGRALTEAQATPKEFNDFDWRCVVVDEAHKIKDPKAQQTMAVKQMGLQAEHRLAMTGTPLLNNPDDIWSIMSFVAPNEWGARNQFRNRYCIMQNAWHGGFENKGLRPELIPEFDSFFQPRFIRRTKTEVLPDLPEKMEIDYRVLPMSPKQTKAYKALTDDMMAVIDGELLVAENPLSLTIRLRQIACALPVVEGGQVVELATPSNKLDAIMDILAESPGEPLVVYAESRKFIELLHRELEKKGYRCGLVTGAQGAAIREQHVANFQAGKLDVMLGTLGAGAEGITLTAASTIVLAQQSWAHATNAQAIDRIHRIGQTRGVHPIVLISEGTIDHAVALMDKTKEGRMQELVRDPEWMKKAMKGEIR